MEKEPQPDVNQHRRQSTWQIIVPLVICGVLTLAAAVWAAFTASGQVANIQAWSSATTIFLVMPVCLGGLLNLTLLILFIYGLGKLQRVTPLYMRVAQNYIGAAGLYIQVALAKIIEPFLRGHAQRAAWQTFWNRILPKRSK